MGPTRELTTIEQKKIYNWVMKSSKEDGVQQEMIATFQGCRNIFLLRMEFRLLKPHKWINSSGKIVEDMLKIVFPTYHHTEIGFQCSYAKVPKQPNNDDYGICMLKFMESWTEDSNLKEFNNEQLNKIRRRLVIEIATSIYNTHRIVIFQKSFDLPQRRNNPNREKKKEVKTAFIAPSTKEITKRAEGKKAAEKRKKK
ncbi:hypothetical protein PIB30_066058 [Stylosanthes scabra]|uniref:Ubiquitin-like protease family profile domain-containing protein n=1 Tax=Stylosanthes scabra TaxID=79078 RepID=A0ABU6RM92_9FABA|nr:hypothetical protein [Stylosanthes scabra]